MRGRTGQDEQDRVNEVGAGVAAAAAAAAAVGRTGRAPLRMVGRWRHPLLIAVSTGAAGGRQVRGVSGGAAGPC